jgi:hypothetical protein
MTEIFSSGYPERTQANILSSDATLILFRGRMDGGTLLTANLCLQHSKPHALIDLTKPSVMRLRPVLSARILNVAGSRESKSPGIHAEAVRFLLPVFEHMLRTGDLCST